MYHNQLPNRWMQIVIECNTHCCYSVLIQCCIMIKTFMYYPKESGKTAVHTVLYIRAHIVVCLCYIMYVLVDSTSIYDAFLQRTNPPFTILPWNRCVYHIHTLPLTTIMMTNCCSISIEWRILKIDTHIWFDLANVSW